jgi:hypothetical protein
MSLTPCSLALQTQMPSKSSVLAVVWQSMTRLFYRMREETLKNLVYVVDKLDEKNLQDRLVRCITNLQNDGENSIRTNSTIFLGRIASKLKDATRLAELTSSAIIELLFQSILSIDNACYVKLSQSP